MALPDQPVGEVDRLLPALVADLPRLLAQVEQQLAPRWPSYAAFLAEHGGLMRAAGGDAMKAIVELASGAKPVGSEQHLELFEGIGRAHYLAGERLTELLSAYQTGARVAWRWTTRAASDQRLGSQDVAALAEALFAFVDGLSAATTRGYLRAQADSAGHRERARSELVDLLLSDRADRRLVESVAARADWVLPPRITVVLTEQDHELAEDVLLHLDPNGLPVCRAGMLGVLAPDLTAAADRKARTAASLRGLQAVVGPAVGPEQLPEAMRVTRLAVRLRAEGHLAGDPVFVADHLDALVVHRDARLLAALRSRVLGPLDAAPVETRERLVETLACWLRHFGDIAAVAEELHVHRQTVRYRLRQLREFLGDALDTPDRRLQLVLVLGW